MPEFKIIDEITDETYAQLKEFFKENDEAPEISLFIDCPGGSVFAALRIVNLIDNFKGKTIARCGILVASSASVVALACDEIRITKDTFLMIHKPWIAQTSGTAEELLSMASLLEQAGKRIEELCTEKAKDATTAAYWFATGDAWFGYEEILANFNGTILIEEESAPSASIYVIGNKLKSAPEALVALVARLKAEEKKEEEDEENPETIPDEEDSEEPAKENPDKETPAETHEEDPEEDNEYAKKVIARAETLFII